jgi:uncharacterized protein
MLTRGKALKVTVYLNQDTASKEGFSYEQVMQFLKEQEVAGATLIRLEEGFGNHHQLHSVTRRHMPVKVEFIDSPEVVEALLPALLELVPDGLVEMHETTILKVAKQEPSF